MIGYPISEEELWDRINVLQPNWQNRSQRRTAKFIQAGKYDESSGIWSEIKRVYMDLQHSKCGYCEKWLEGTDYGLIENDVEHYRPKSRVRAYPPISHDPVPRDDRARLHYNFSTGDAWETGYFRLAYHPLNYLTSCKTCNSIFKSDYFPVAENRIDGARHPRDLADEKPFLIYPIGELDVKPEELIGFDGITAIPIGETRDERRRAEVTIDFFDLNNRDDLRRQRLLIIRNLHLCLTGRQTNRDESWQRSAILSINFQMAPQANHANCARCFVRLFQSDEQRATRLAREVAQLIE